MNIQNIKVIRTEIEISAKELIHNYLTMIEAIVDEYDEEEVMKMHITETVAAIQSTDGNRIVKLFKDGLSIILVPEIANHQDNEIKLSIIMSDGEVLEIYNNQITI